MEVLFQRCIPSTLKELTLYEDFDGFYKPLKTGGRPSLPKLSAAILGASTKLDLLAVSFVIDARDFFLPFSPMSDLAPPGFPQLQFIAITSDDLDPSKGAEHVNNLLYSAGNAALRMPKLQVMELWNGRPGEAAVFRYERSPPDIVATLTWSSSWTFFPNPKVFDQWRKVADKHMCPGFRMNLSKMPAGPGCPGSILKYLRLRHQIVHPLSLHEIQKDIDEAQDI
jgi:hypothetical protein